MRGLTTPATQDSVLTSKTAVWKMRPTSSRSVLLLQARSQTLSVRIR